MPLKLPKFTYEIPDRYRNSFYLVNAAFFDQVNWYLHHAYELCFPKLVTQLKNLQPNLTDPQAVQKVHQVIKILDQCNSVLDIRFPIKLENGTKEVVRGFRAHHGLYSGFGTCMGGLRVKEDLTRDHVKALAVLTTYKHACMGVRLAGGHGGVKINPGRYKPIELQRITKKYAAELYRKGFCDGQTDIIEPDINVGGREMAWIAAIFPKDYERVMVAGKPVELGGIPNYEKMASQGIFFALDYFLNNDAILERIGMSKGGLQHKTYIIQGIGKLGGALAKFLENCGATCVGIKEQDAFIYDMEGINIQSVLDYFKANKTILNYTNAKPVSNDDIFKEQCDILILAAEQKTLNCHIADKIKAKVIIEGANGAITPTAHRILTGRKKLVLPDIYVSSGHSIASYLEYLFHLKRDGLEFPVLRNLYWNILDYFDAEKVQGQVVSTATTQKILCCDVKPDILSYGIEHVMAETGKELIEIAKEFRIDLDLRTAGYIKAVQSIHNSIYEAKKY
ncbi:glutamate dehydrogenase, mitochondrial [Tribolium castaneum]|uniref:Glutamate dehydrogenase n=1 Tax=Tribolium castaneum TaxID=7070 RepID=A0A139WAW2_TRICA|nr:PREDICTED: glutamate dehydrogenase, mitochondrial-like [Tribolium castaneum]KYB25039.1 Glutamate dehydrogenase, mitochondrial-like Protein [Tribolium castaneum]|eukprot:XP_968790.1 PREDICTED: glutamate dehydrogenase, mitochondrial-like [Tribolium castaneum]